MNLLIIAAVAAAVQSPPPVCKSLGAAILASEKQLSELSWDGVADDSAPRATMRAAQSTAQLVAIQANMMLLAEHHCPPYPFAISDQSFESAAIACDLAIKKAVEEGRKDATKTAECDRSTWMRTP